MDLLDKLKILLDNPKLKEEHGYSEADIQQLDLYKRHNNEFIQFMQDAIKLMNNTEDSVRIAAGKLIKTFE